MSHEKQVRGLGGWAMLAVTIAVFLVAAELLREFVYSAIEAGQKHQIPNLYLLVSEVLVIAPALSCATGSSPCSRTKAAC